MTLRAVSELSFIIGTMASESLDQSDVKMASSETALSPLHPKSPISMIESDGVTVFAGSGLGLAIVPNFLSQNDSSNLFDELTARVTWSRPLFNAKSQLSKLRGGQTYGDHPVGELEQKKLRTYDITWYGRTAQRTISPWLDCLKKIRGRLELTLETSFPDFVVPGSFNICYVQRYPSGDTGISPHRDKEMQPGSIIAGVSLGETRSLILCRRSEEFKVTLTPGSLYLLFPPTNDLWSHCIPIEPERRGTRISLTYRTYYPSIH